jgi:hypothetical protein
MSARLNTIMGFEIGMLVVLKKMNTLKNSHDQME